MTTCIHVKVMMLTFLLPMSIFEATVKASKFEHHVNFGLFLQAPYLLWMNYVHQINKT